MSTTRVIFDPPKEVLADFCRRQHIARLSFFGSVTRDDFGPDSDVDVLVEFEDGHVPGMITFSGMELELTRLFQRKVDLNTPGCFGPDNRKRVLKEAVLQFDTRQSDDGCK